MAVEVKSWRANDGSLHEDECTAATRDVELIVEQSPLSENQPYAKKLVEWMTANAKLIRETLEAHERACPKSAVEVLSDDKIFSPLMLADLETRRNAAIGEMQDRGKPAKEWLLRQGFSDLSDFVARSGIDDLTAWERFRDEPRAFGNGSKKHGR